MLLELILISIDFFHFQELLFHGFVDGTEHVSSNVTLSNPNHLLSMDQKKIGIDDT